ncbi:hypothetical protein F2Q68_00021137 [Brassica cretica]|uniref:Uncharacterized protein n=1 Tax=Brassica cretica TaxID=69181 RepID=A0A8S9FYG6_BRACR|nr:hypothetical protein F2Q68_00021137 [Brassica cretica]
MGYESCRLRIEAPVRLSHAESWREGVVIHCKGGPYPRNWVTGLPGQATSQEAARTRGGGNRFELCRTLSGSIDGKKGNALKTHKTSNGTHGDVGKIDMCVLNPASRNPGWKWGRGGCYKTVPRTGTETEERRRGETSNRNDRGVAEPGRSAATRNQPEEDARTTQLETAQADKLKDKPPNQRQGKDNPDEDRNSNESNGEWMQRTEEKTEETKG